MLKLKVDNAGAWRVTTADRTPRSAECAPFIAALSLFQYEIRMRLPLWVQLKSLQQPRAMTSGVPMVEAGA